MIASVHNILKKHTMIVIVDRLGDKIGNGD